MVATTIYERAESLVSFPFKGHIGRIQGTRELVMAPLPWIVVYRVGEVVEIVRIYHGAQDWPQVGIPFTQLPQQVVWPVLSA